MGKLIQFLATLTQGGTNIH